MTFPLPFFLMVLTNAFGIARTSTRLPFIQILSAAGILMVFSTLLTNQGEPKPDELVAVALTIIGGLFVQWYVWSFSNYNRGKSKAIVKGQGLPELQLRRLDGSYISSSSFEGSNTLLMFFRANWCPFCMNQLNEVLARADRLKGAGVNVKFVSNQGMENSQQLAKKLNLPEHFEILQDDDLKAAKVLGIEDIGGAPAGMPGYPGDTVMATVIALDEIGAVIFGDETDNYRVRPHPDSFIPVFER